MDKPNEIGKIIKSRLNELHESPDGKVWERISAQLDQKKKKDKIIPLWFKISGVAALILAVFMTKNYWTNTPISNDIPVTVEENTSTTSNSTEPINSSVAEINATEANNLKESSLPKKVSTSQPTHNISNRIKTIDRQFSQNLYQEKIQTTETNDLIAQSKKITNPNDTLLISNQNKTQLATIESVKINQENTDNEGEISKNVKETIIVEKENLEEFTTKETVKIKKKNRIELAVKSAPIWYNSLEKGSSLSYALEEHQKKSEQTMSYGLIASIRLGDKLKLRTGINQLDLSYTTKSVTETDALYSQNGGYFTETFDEITATPTETSSVLGNLYDMTQNISYWEVPLEFEYPLISKKWSVNLISGFSTLILKNNSVLLNNENLGKVDNLNNMSFTGNIGLGLNYEFLKNWQFNLEPTAKIQLNPYNNSTDYKPYFYGIYLGFSHKF